MQPLTRRPPASQMLLRTLWASMITSRPRVWLRRHHCWPTRSRPLQQRRPRPVFSLQRKLWNLTAEKRFAGEPINQPRGRGTPVVLIGLVFAGEPMINRGSRFPFVLFLMDSNAHAIWFRLKTGRFFG